MLRECSPPQTCHVSHVKCHMSRVKCQNFSPFFFGQSGEAYQWRVCLMVHLFNGLPNTTRVVFQ